MTFHHAAGSNEGGFKRIGFGILLVAMLLLCACEGPGETPPKNIADRDTSTFAKIDSGSAGSTPSEDRYRRQIRQSIAAGDLDAADRLVQSALISYPASTTLLRDAAEIQHRLGNVKPAADLLVQACRQSDYGDASMVQATLATLEETGQLYRLAEQAGKAFARQVNQIQWLWKRIEILYGLERRDDAQRAAMQIVKARQFNLPLLERMAWDRQRELDSALLNQAYQRNPEDPRVLIGSLRRQIENSDMQAAEETETQISQRYPRDPLLAFWSAERIQRDHRLDPQERINATRDWFAKRLPAPEQRDGGTWMAIGKMAELIDDTDLASAAFRIAALKRPHDAACWVSWARRFPPSTQSDSVATAVRQRAADLDQLGQTLDQWRIRRRSDMATGLQIVRQLYGLGRIWEAEAWAAAILTQFQNSEPGQAPEYREIARLRQDIVSELQRDTPDVVIRDARLRQWIQGNDDTSAAQTQLQRVLQSLDAESTSSIAATAKTDSPDGPVPRFRDVTASMRLQFFGRTADDLSQRGIQLHQTLGCGGGTIDFDRDGKDDLVFADAGGTPRHGGHRPNRLFRSLGPRFQDVTTPSRYADTEFGQGIAVGDFNADGWDDLFDANYGRNRLFINQGDGTFQESPIANDDDAWSSTAAIADIDGDGFADIVYVNYCEGASIPMQFCSDDKQIVSASLNDPAQSVATIDARLKHHACSPMQYPGTANAWIAGGNASELRVRCLQASNRSGVPSNGRSLGLSVFRDRPSVDGNGTGLSVLITNDMSANEIWSGSKKGRTGMWQQSANLLGLANGIDGQPEGSMGIASDDLNRDGRLDFLVTNFENEYNSLYRSDRVGYVVPPSSTAAATFKAVGFGVVAEDFAETGEHYWGITNGHVDDFADLRDDSSLLQKMQWFWFGDGGEVMQMEAEESGETGYFDAVHCGRSLWTADLNQDHRVDLVVTHQNEPVVLLQNETPIPQGRSYANIEIVGVASDRNAIGTWLSFQPPTSSDAWVCTAEGYLSSVCRRLHLSWDSASPPETLVVDWPSGRREEVSFAELAARGPASCVLIEGQGLHVHR
ncbi:MAG: CRTAC1 family protein [Planctomycetota bacterium]